MNDLADGAGAGQFADEPLKERAPTASKTRQIDNPRYGPSCRHGADIRARGGGHIAIASWSSRDAVASCGS